MSNQDPADHCTHRHDSPKLLPRFQCSHPMRHSPDQVVWQAVCDRCRYHDHGVRNTAPVLDGIKPPLAEPKVPCNHLGGLLRTEKCETCRGNVRVKHYACNLLGIETTVGICRQCELHTGREPLLPASHPEEHAQPQDRHHSGDLKER